MPGPEIGGLPAVALGWVEPLPISARWDPEAVINPVPHPISGEVPGHQRRLASAASDGSAGRPYPEVGQEAIRRVEGGDPRHPHLLDQAVLRRTEGPLDPPLRPGRAARITSTPNSPSAREMIVSVRSSFFASHCPKCPAWSV